MPLALRIASFPITALDRARLVFLRGLGPWAKPLVRDRELRVAVVGTLSVLIALLLTALAPLALLALGPIALGVPHAAADVRYLVTRPGLHRRPLFWVLVMVPLVALVVSFDVRWGAVAVMGGALASQASLSRRVLLASVGAALLALAWSHSYTVALFAAHLHNLVAMGFWLAWRRARRGRLYLVPVFATAAGAALIMAGALEPVAAWTGGLSGYVGDVDLGFHLSSLAPGVEEPWGTRLVLLFAFAQSVHYAIWLRLVPEEDRERETPRTFAASLRAFRQDSGAWVVAAAFVLCAIVAVWAIFDLYGARMGYLRGVLFHGWMELGIVMLLLAEGRRLGA